MKAYKKLTAALAALIMCLSLPTAAMAADTAEAPVPQPAPAPELDISLEGKSWDDVMDELLVKYNTNRYSICAAYLNLATGEENYINPDTYTRVSSMYKLPLNMYFADTKHGGIETWSANYQELDFAQLRDKTLIESDKQCAASMCELIGGYNQFRLATAEYMGMSADELDSSHFENNEYTAKQFAQCLKLLYNESGRFPMILETMQKASPGQFLQYYDNGADVAHKHGSLGEEGDMSVHDCGIVFTDEPIALVMMTHNVPNAEEFIGAYCTLMCRYAEYVRTAPDSTPDANAGPVIIKDNIDTAQPDEEKASFPFVACAGLVIFVIGTMALFISMSVKYHIRAFWLLLCLLISSAAIGLSIIGMHLGTVYAKPSGDPGQSAEEFLSAVCEGNYPAAYGLLRDYADLGLENMPDTEAAKLAYAALHESFSYELRGQCSTNKLDAAQPYSFTYLDLTRLESAVVEETPKQLRRLVAARPMNQIYDSNRNFLPEVTEEAYLNALSAVLENAGSYYSTIEGNLLLSYSDGRWQVLTSPALLRALNGGAGY